MDFVADNWDEHPRGTGIVNRRSCLALAIALMHFSFAPAAIASPPFAGSAPRGSRFGHITVENGLTDQRVTAIMQDRAGFMWFGTNNGLNRYDGYRIVSFRADPNDPFSLSGNVILDLLEDRKIGRAHV